MGLLPEGDKMKKYTAVFLIFLCGALYAYWIDAQQDARKKITAASVENKEIAPARPMGIFGKNLLARANRLYEQGKYEEAFLKYEELRDKYPDNPLAYYGMGSVWYAAGNFAMAIDRYNIAIKLEPNFAEAYYWLGNAYFKAGKKEDAVRAWKECLKIDPGNENAKEKLKALSR